MIMISPGADMRGGVRQDASSMETLKLTDYQALKDECHFIKAISPLVQSSGQFIYGNNNTPSSIYGANLDYLEIRQLSVAEGEMFTETEIKSAAKVCLLGRRWSITSSPTVPTPSARSFASTPSPSVSSE